MTRTLVWLKKIIKYLLIACGAISLFLVIWVITPDKYLPCKMIDFKYPENSTWNQRQIECHQQTYESVAQTMSFDCENGTTFNAKINKNSFEVTDINGNVVAYTKEESPDGIIVYGDKDYAYTFVKDDDQVIFTKRSESSGPSSTLCHIKISTIGELDPDIQAHIKSVIKVADEEKDYQVKFLDNEFFVQQNSVTDNGQELRGFFKNGQIYKIAYSVGLSYAMKSYLFYFENGVPVYVYEHEQNYPYNESTGGLDYGRLEPAFDAGYTFNEGKLAMIKYSGERRMSDGKPQLLTEQELLDDAQKYSKLLTEQQNEQPLTYDQQDIKFVGTLKDEDGNFLGDVYVSYLIKDTFSALYITKKINGKDVILYKANDKGLFNTAGKDIDISTSNGFFGYIFVSPFENNFDYVSLYLANKEGQGISDTITIKWNENKNLFEIERIPDVFEEFFKVGSLDAVIDGYPIGDIGVSYLDKDKNILNRLFVSRKTFGQESGIYRIMNTGFYNTEGREFRLDKDNFYGFKLLSIGKDYFTVDILSKDGEAFENKTIRWNYSKKILELDK